ncbi:hypothetical protein BMJ22_07380, partial [Sinorhizobium medicae]
AIRRLILIAALYLLDVALAKSNIKLRWFYEVTNLSTSLGLVDALRDFSPAAHDDPPQDDHPFLNTRPISDPEISRTIGVVRRRGGTLSPAAERFLKMLMGVWGSN